MNIVVISPRLPYPLEKGDKLRLYHQLKALAKEHNVVLISLTDVEVDKNDIEHLKSFISKLYVFKLSKFKIGFRLITGIFSSKPFQVLYYLDQSIKIKIHSIIQDEKPDFIFNQLLRTTEYTKELFYFKILDYMDSFSQGMKKRLGNSSFPFSFVYNMEYKRLKKYETDIFSSFNKHMIISEQDKNAFDKSVSNDIEIVPNGVDLSFFKPQSVNKRYQIGFVGNMGYRPNIIASEFLVKEIYPLLLKKNISVKILLAGARPNNRVKSLNSQNVIVSGWIEDIRDAYGESEIFVAPLFTGIGQQNKILEAMSMEIPVITTTSVNNAIGAKPGVEILIANSADEFVGQIQYLLENKEVALKLGKLGRVFVLNNFSWDFQGKNFLNLFK